MWPVSYFLKFLICIFQYAKWKHSDSRWKEIVNYFQCHLKALQATMCAEHCPIKYLGPHFHAGANLLQCPCTGKVAISLAESRFFLCRHPLGDFMIVLPPPQARYNRTGFLGGWFDVHNGCQPVLTVSLLRPFSLNM